jgi:peptidyl-prolyl cis-trans isomerase D
MLAKMRENMPLIMWILVGAFLATIVFSWGMGGFKSKGQLDGVVGRVGGHEILYDRYNRLVQDRVAQERQKNPDAEMADTQVKQIRKQAWDDLVREQILSEYRDRFGIVTSDQEVAYAVRNNPPSYIKENANFQTDGSFDRSKYEQFLRDPQSANILVSIEDDYRSSIANQKVIDRVIAPVFVTPNEVWDEYAATTRKFKAAAVTFPLRNFAVDSMSITAQEIQQYYDEHKSDYQRKERRKLAFVTVPVVATADDTTRIAETAQEALSRAKAGEDFAALATEYSEDEGSAKQGGDLGYFTSGRMVKEFDSTAFNTPVGQVAGPVVTRFGIHIIKVVDRKSGGAAGDSVRASHILIKWKVGTDTEERASQKAKDLTDAAKTDGFEKAAAQAGLEVKETDLFTKNTAGSVPGVGSLLPVMDFAFGSKKNAVSYAFKTKIRGDDGYSVFQIREISPEGLVPLSEAEPSIRTALVKKKQEDLALAAARAFRSKVNTPAQFLTEATRESLKVDTTGEHLQRDFLQVFGSDEQIAKTMFTLQPGQLSDPLSNSRAAYVAVLIFKTDADSAGFQAKRSEIETKLRQSKQNNLYTDWLAQAEREIGVVDKRYLYYTDY